MAGLKQGCTLKGGKYKIVKTLGQGSFGITYLATTRISMDGQLGKMDVTVNVTIKEFFMSDLNSRASDGTGVERTNSTLVKNYLNKFRKEAENLAKLNHPNIVKVLEVFDENNTTYYVMEYIDGETIDDYIKSKGHLSESESLKITQEVCAALSYMHEHKMLHLDLKPKNIMRNSEGHIFLIDFGLAKQYNDYGEPESSTTLGLGTPGYAPIEQAHYKQDGTFPVTLDIYAVGASLYKMLTGKTPPESSYVLNERLPIDGLKEDGVSDSVISVVEKAMEPLKKDRYQTVGEMSGALKNCDLSKEEIANVDIICSEDDEGTQYGADNLGGNSGAKEVNDEGHEGQNEKHEDEKKYFVQKYWKHGALIVVLLLGAFFVLYFSSKNSSDEVIKYYTDLSTIQIGDYLYADGTFTHKLDSANLTNCSGCVYNLTTTESEKNEGWTHGHIVALKDAVNRKGETEFEWGHTNSDIPECQSYSEAIKAKDGYSYCLLDSACLSPAICSVYHFFEGYIFNEPLPDKCHWYVPTLSDWKDILVNLGKATVTGEELRSYDDQTVSSTLHNKIGGFKKNRENIDDGFHYSYWTCIQRGAEYTPYSYIHRAWAIYAHGRFGGTIGYSDTKSKMRVRPVAAF